MQMNPYLTFNGQCEAAFRFYERCLGGKMEAMQAHSSTPAEHNVPPAWRGKILHARLAVGDCILMGSDFPPGLHEETRGFSVSIEINDPADAERTFYALVENGTVVMPIQTTFWSVRFGMLIDQFGIPWLINCKQTS